MAKTVRVSLLIIGTQRNSLTSLELWFCSFPAGLLVAGAPFVIRDVLALRHIRAGPDELIVSSGFKSFAISYARVMEVRMAKGKKETGMIIRLDFDSPFGREIRFIPYCLWRTPKEHPAIALLNERAGLLKPGRNDYQPPST